MLALPGSVHLRPINDMLGDDLSSQPHLLVELIVRLAGFTQKLEQTIDDERDFTGTTDGCGTRGCAS